MKSIHHSSPVKKKGWSKSKTLVFKKVMRAKFSPGKDKQGGGSDYIHEK